MQVIWWLQKLPLEAPLPTPCPTQAGWYFDPYTQKQFVYRRFAAGMRQSRSMPNYQMKWTPPIVSAAIAPAGGPSKTSPAAGASGAAAPAAT